MGQLVESGLRHVFANPGTTEMPLVEALDAEPGLMATLCLHENVCTGAADGYARASGLPAAALLHLGPGLTNGSANLQNARRARSGAVVLVGDHPDRHLASDSPLQAPLETLASAVSDWSIRASDPTAVTVNADEAYQRAAFGQIATLIIPADTQVAAAPARRVAAQPLLRSRARDPEPIVSALATAARPCLIVGGSALSEKGLADAAALAATFSAAFYCEPFFAVMDRGQGRSAPQRIPYFPEAAAKLLAEHDLVVLAGAAEPVAFFAYPDMPTRLVPRDATLLVLAGPTDDAERALQMAVAAAGAKAMAHGEPPLAARIDGIAALKVSSLCATVAAALPENSILVDEGITSSIPFYDLSTQAKPFRHMTLTGGAIGWGPGAALGAALGAPDATIVNVQADGSALYLPQALWSQARSGARVVTVLCSNRTYRILGAELARAGISSPGPKASDLCDLAGLDWQLIARGFGVPATRASTADELSAAMARAIASEGPSLIEAVLP